MRLNFKVLISVVISLGLSWACSSDEKSSSRKRSSKAKVGGQLLNQFTIQEGEFTNGLRFMSELPKSFDKKFSLNFSDTSAQTLNLSDQAIKDMLGGHTPLGIYKLELQALTDEVKPSENFYLSFQVPQGKNANHLRIFQKEKGSSQTLSPYVDDEELNLAGNQDQAQVAMVKFEFDTTKAILFLFDGGNSSTPGGIVGNLGTVSGTVSGTGVTSPIGAPKPPAVAVTTQGASSTPSTFGLTATSGGLGWLEETDGPQLKSTDSMLESGPRIFLH